MTPTPNPVMNPVTRDRVEMILDAYGADPAHWPEAERDAALALVRDVPELSRRMQIEAELDSLLDALPAPAPHPSARVRLKAIADQTQGVDWRALLWPFGPVWRPAAGLALALLVGIGTGVADPFALGTAVADSEATLTYAALVDGADDGFGEIVPVGEEGAE